MPNKDVLFTVVYPQALPYFGDVCASVKEQTNKNFDFLVINDGCEEENLKSFLTGIENIIINAIGCPSKNRQQGINYAWNNGYRYIIFCDADDSFVPKRYNRTIAEFENSGADIIVSNLNVVDCNLKSIIDNYFSWELPCDRWIDEEFIVDKNIFGMSNTALRLSSLKNDVYLPDTKIGDWYLFTLLLHNGLSARYISEALVNYRQYNNNLIGINRFDISSFRRLAFLKFNHYKLLVENGYDRFCVSLFKSKELLSLTDDEIKKTIKQQLSIHKQPLWWQIISKTV